MPTGRDVFEFGANLPVPADPRLAAFVLVVKVGTVAIGSLMLLSWFTGTKSEVEFEASMKNGLKFKHMTDKRQDDLK